eukprot:3484163-Alexandrium_andersonii.AAC.1
MGALLSQTEVFKSRHGKRSMGGGLACGPKPPTDASAHLHLFAPRRHGEVERGLQGNALTSVKASRLRGLLFSGSCFKLKLGRAARRGQARAPGRGLLAGVRAPYP